MSNYIVTARGMVACKGVPGAAVNWRPLKDYRFRPPPADLLEWSTDAGAAKFADMHGGDVTTRMELFYSPKEITP